MVVVFSIIQVWHICSYKQEVVLPYVYFGCLPLVSGRADGIWALQLEYVEGGKWKVEKP